MHRRVVQVVTQMESGGAQTVALSLHRELLLRGIDAELWFLYLKTPVWIGEPGVRYLWRRRPKIHQMGSLLWTLFRWIRITKPDLVIAHTHYANAIVLPLAKACNIAARVAVHHNAISTYPWLARQLELICKGLGCCTESVAVSQDVCQSLWSWKPQMYTDSTRYVYNGLATQPNGFAQVQLPYHQACTGRRILFNVGRLAEQKNQLALVEALPSMPDCVMVIAGCGPMQSLLLEKADALGVSSQLVLLGEVAPGVVRGWMEKADVFVFPSRFEAMPMALLEAMRAGMVIVASDIAAHRELVGKTAILTATDPSSISHAIQTALRLKEAGDSTGFLAKERSLQFTVEAMADGYLASS